jgi:hypothetical protein
MSPFEKWVLTHVMGVYAGDAGNLTETAFFNRAKVRPNSNLNE